MKPSTLALTAALLLAAGPTWAAEPIGYTAPDGVNAVPVTQAQPLPVGITINASATFTTPAGTTAYASGQAISNSATAGSVAPMAFAVCRNAGGTGMVRKARIRSNDTGFAAGQVRLHLYRDPPSVTGGDHGTFLSTESGWLDDIDVVLDHAFSDPQEKGVGVPNRGTEINFDCGAGLTTIYGLVEARSAITPVGGKTITVVLETLAN